MTTEYASATLSPQHAYKAAAIVEHAFPPTDIDAVYAVLAALNLLNAAVKTGWGVRIVTYGYIKGMVSCVFFWLFYHPVKGVAIYWDDEQRVAYFKVYDMQFSFHYAPLLHENSALFRHLRKQQWDGRQLQPEALRLMAPVWRDRLYAELKVSARLLRRMRSFDSANLRHILCEQVDARLAPQKHRSRHRMRIASSWNRQPGWEAPKQKSDKQQFLALEQALHFNIWTTNYCELCHRPDHFLLRLVRYDGHNYDKIRHIMGEDVLPVTPRCQRSLRLGRLYYRPRGQFKWCMVAPSRHLLMLSYYCNLRVDNHYYNLCLTYDIVRFLSILFPQLRFINILNYTRFVVHRHIYTPADLAHVPLMSNARLLKVWMVVDPQQLLAHFNIDTLPPKILLDYLNTPDYLDMFKVVYHHGQAGLYAYSRFHLLPTDYRSIKIHGRYAWVMHHNGKLAIYNLLQERFVSPAIYDSIWYDARRYMLCARHNGVVDILHACTV